MPAACSHQKMLSRSCFRNRLSLWTGRDPCAGNGSLLWPVASIPLNRVRANPSVGLNGNLCGQRRSQTSCDYT